MTARSLGKIERNEKGNSLQRAKHFAAPNSNPPTRAQIENAKRVSEQYGESWFTWAAAAASQLASRNGRRPSPKRCCEGRVACDSHDSREYRASFVDMLIGPATDRSAEQNSTGRQRVRAAPCVSEHTMAGGNYRRRQPTQAPVRTCVQRI